MSSLLMQKISNDVVQGKKKGQYSLLPVSSQELLEGIWKQRRILLFILVSELSFS